MIDTEPSKLMNSLQDTRTDEHTNPARAMTPATNRTVYIVKRAVADSYGVEVAALDSMRKPARLSEARNVAMYLCRELLTTDGAPLSFPGIAESFRRKKHGSAMYAFRTVANRLELEPTFAEQVGHLRTKLETFFREN